MMRRFVAAAVIGLLPQTATAQVFENFEEALAFVREHEDAVFETPSGTLLAFYVPLDLIWRVSPEGTGLDTGIARQSERGDLGVEWNARGFANLPQQALPALTVADVEYPLPRYVRTLHGAVLAEAIGPFPAGAQFDDFFRVTNEEGRNIGNWFPFPERLLLTDFDGSETIWEYGLVLNAIGAEE